VATAVLSPAEIAAPVRQLEVKQPNLSVLLAEVTGIDVASRTIKASAPGVGVRKIAYDYLVVAAGMRPSYFGRDEFARFAPGLKNLSDAETIRAKILSAFEVAETTEDEVERARQMTFVLVGAGPTGVELAASLAHIRIAVVASPVYLKRRKAPVAPSELLEHECLVYTGRPEPSPWVFQVGRRPISIRPAGRFRADYTEALLRAAEAGLGIAALPNYLTANGIEAGRLVELLTDFPFLERGFYVVRPPGAYVPAKVRALIDLLVETFADRPVWDRLQQHPTGSAQ
jgi:hypothetical protein